MLTMMPRMILNKHKDDDDDNDNNEDNDDDNNDYYHENVCDDYDNDNAKSLLS